MKTKWILLAGMVLIALIGGPLLSAGAWSLNPFASSDSTQTKQLNNPAVKPRRSSRRSCRGSCRHQAIRLRSRQYADAKDIRGENPTVQPVRSRLAPRHTFSGSGAVAGQQRAIVGHGQCDPQPAPSKEVRSTADFLDLNRVQP